MPGIVPGGRDTMVNNIHSACNSVGETENERSNYRWLKKDKVLTVGAKTTGEVHCRGSYT